MSMWTHRFGRRSNCCRRHAINIRRVSISMAKPQPNTIYCCCNKVSGNNNSNSTSTSSSIIRVIISLMVAIVMSAAAATASTVLLLRQHQYIRIHVALREETRQEARGRRRDLVRHIRWRRRRRRRRLQPPPPLPAFNNSNNSSTIDLMRCRSPNQLLSNPPQQPHSRRTYPLQSSTKIHSICITSEVPVQVLVAVWVHPLAVSYWAMAPSILSPVPAANVVDVSSVKVQDNCHRPGCATKHVSVVPRPSLITHRVCAALRRSSTTVPEIKTWNAMTAIAPCAWTIPARACPTNAHNAGVGSEPFLWFYHVFGVIGRCAVALQSVKNVTHDTPAMAVDVKPLARQAACCRSSILAEVEQEAETPQLVALSHRELVEEFIAVLAEVAIIIIIFITMAEAAVEAVALATLVAVTSVPQEYCANATSHPRKDCSTQVLNTNSNNYINYNIICSVK